MRILVVCGAGASSTFIAQRLRRAAESAGLDLDAYPGTELTIDHAFADLVLLGPHIADRLEPIRARVPIPVAVLPADVQADRDGALTLALVLAELERSPGLPSSTRSSSSAKGTS
ncbi:hypothetical protein [uncultured Microbacterium sp.]|uniref:PTS sugar transporter subunit IIB n=1 Tax=uncultured Microbacterium sp. TaxID=191216 RepID=UPI00260FD8FB|nr:hypothetical protein [uncultured Microbacterium sp.]